MNHNSGSWCDRLHSCMHLHSYLTQKLLDFVTGNSLQKSIIAKQHNITQLVDKWLLNTFQQFQWSVSLVLWNKTLIQNVTVQSEITSPFMIYKCSDTNKYDSQCGDVLTATPYWRWLHTDMMQWCKTSPRGDKYQMSRELLFSAGGNGLLGIYNVWWSHTWSPGPSHDLPNMTIHNTLPTHITHTMAMITTIIINQISYGSTTWGHTYTLNLPSRLTVVSCEAKKEQSKLLKTKRAMNYCVSFTRANVFVIWCHNHSLYLLTPVNF